MKKYFFSYVQVAADAEYEPSDDNELETNFTVNVSVEKDEASDIYQVVLEIIAEPENDESRIPYTIHLITIGLFSVDEGFPDKKKLLGITGASMLYSAAREFIITVTSRGPWAPIFIPTFSFLPTKEKEDSET
ncbi:conserved hypothetical protein [delta proteobacterium NaphS2]|nr:conserved hypothetical protein [delta proteobacterium NaphS2]